MIAIIFLFYTLQANVCDLGYNWCKAKSCCDINSDCYCDQSCDGTNPDPKWGCSYDPYAESRCDVFGCTCHGISNYFGIKFNSDFGCTPAWAQDWWNRHSCQTSPQQESPYPGCTQTLCDDTVITGLTMSGSRSSSGHCPDSCKCSVGKASNGGQKLAADGYCYNWCSKDFSGYRYCGTGENYEVGGIDCRGCSGRQVRDDGCCADGDFNRYAGGNSVFLFQHKYEFKPAGKGLIALEAFMGSARCKSGYELVQGCCGNNFNDGAGGKTIYLCAKYAEYGPFIDEVRMYGSQKRDWDPPCNNNDGWYKLANPECEDGCDFNEGTGGLDHMHIYICYHKMPQCFLPSRIEDTKKLCKYIVDETDKSGGYPLTEVMVQGVLVKIDWDVFHFDPTAKVKNQVKTVIGGPWKCPDQGTCSVTYTETEITSHQWSLTGGVAINAGWAFEITGGVPGIAKITGRVEIGASVGIEIMAGGKKEFESSISSTMACARRDFATTCTIYATRGDYLVNGMATPIFMFEGERIECKDFVDTTHIEWWGQSDTMLKAGEEIICEDDPDFSDCEGATEDLCRQVDVIRWNCPKTCNQYAEGPPSCVGGPDCNFVPVEECPSPSDLEPSNSYYLDCQEAVFKVDAICEAYKPFTTIGAPEDWHIENCAGKPNANGEAFMHSIWQWHCDKVNEVSSQKKDVPEDQKATQNLGSADSHTAGDKKQGFKETWTEHHYKEHTWTPLSIFGESVDKMNVITCILALIGVCSTIVAFKNRCMKTNSYATIEDARSEI